MRIYIYICLYIIPKLQDIAKLQFDNIKENENRSNADLNDQIMHTPTYRYIYD